MDIVLDGRLAEPFDLSVPNPDATPVLAVYMFETSFEGMSQGYYSFGPPPHELRFAQLGPDLPGGSATTRLSAGWTAGDTDSREWYHAAWTSDDSLLAGHRASPGIDEFATIETTIGRTHNGHDLSFWGGVFTDSDNFQILPTDGEPPARGTNFVFGDGIPWSFDVNQEQRDTDPPAWDTDPPATVVRSGSRHYHPGQAYSETYNVGVFGPSLAPSSSGVPGAVRIGDEFWAYVPMFGDGAGNVGFSWPNAEANSTLRIDGDEIYSIDDIHWDPLRFPGAGHTVPTDAGRFELSSDITRSTDVSLVSTRVQATWTFDAPDASDGEPQEFPLSVVRFSPDLAPTSSAPAGRSMRIPFTVEGAAVGKVKEVAFAVSFDEGETWEEVRTVHEDWFLVKNPKGQGSVSLRVHLTDEDGNMVEQTIERAYLTAGGQRTPGRQHP
jgi:hypothetical protein